MPSFEDSQIDQFQAYASPYTLYWPANKKLMGELSSFALGNNTTNNTLANLSDVERRRGGGGAISPNNNSTSNLTQMPIGKSLNWNQKNYKLNFFKYLLLLENTLDNLQSLKNRMSLLSKHDKDNESHSSSSLSSNHFKIDDSKLTSLTKLDIHSGLSSGDMSRTRR